MKAFVKKELQAEEAAMDASTDPDPGGPPLCPDDVAALFRREAVRVRRLVRLNVNAPDAVVEDACQVAWMRLLNDPARVRRAAATRWLVRVAVREALRGARRTTRDLSLDALLADAGSGPAPVDRTPAPDDLAQQHQRLGTLDELPERQRRLVWLRGLGFSYREMADETGDTVRTVERQLERARINLARAGALPDS
jgi:RNA polymerase sigma factor (sigma-70 family)